MLRWSFAVLLALACLPARTQIVHLAELNTTQITALDRAHTVILIPDGIMEEHGPFMPSYTDGYVDEALTRDFANALVARPGWAVAIFPAIPLGTNPANVIGGKYSFPASFAISQRAIRDVYMDLADSFGELGFRHIFIIDSHGGPTQSVALDAASDYFHDTFHGTMLHLLGTMRIFDCCHPLEESLTKQQVAANGLSVHADALEQSLLLFLRPDLAPAGYRTAPINGSADFPGLQATAAAPNWPGYLGAPAYATPAIGALAYRELLEATTKLANEILDGKTDPYKLLRYGATMLDPTAAIETPMLRHNAEVQRKHDNWLAAHPSAIASPPAR